MKTAFGIRSKTCEFVEYLCLFFPEINPENPPPAFMVYAGLEPLSFTNLFPFWTVEANVRDLNLKVSNSASVHYSVFSPYEPVFLTFLLCKVSHFV